MKSNLTRVDTRKMTKDEWLAFRFNGIGGSEVGTVLGLNKYMSSLELFYKKISALKDTEENEAMFWGKALEEIIAERWQYWDGTPESMIENYYAGKIVRKCRRANAIIVNEKYPFLFCNLDRVINTNGNDKEGVLEIKTISGYSSAQWEGGIPPMYLMQLQTYLLITELEYGEIAMLRDGRYLEVLPFEKNETIQQAIIEQCSEFWSRVERARKVMQEAGVIDYDELNNHPERMQHNAMLQTIEPEPDGSEAYESFMSTRFKAAPITKDGDYETFLDALRYVGCSNVIDKIKNVQTYYSNKIKSIMGEAEILSFGVRGKVTWKENSRGIRTMRMSIKEDKINNDDMRAIEALNELRGISSGINLQLNTEQ